MEMPKICWQSIQFHSKYGVDHSKALLSNKAFFLPSSDHWIPSVLNSPAVWYLSWRHFPHMKDEALSNDAVKIVSIPIPVVLSGDGAKAKDLAGRLIETTATIREADEVLADWLRQEIGLPKLTSALAQVSRLDSDGFIVAVRAALPKRAGITPMRLAQLRAAFADIAESARSARATAQRDERALSDIVNRAYGLTTEDVSLMWRTAPPRMPLTSSLAIEPPSTDAAADLR